MSKIFNLIKRALSTRPARGNDNIPKNALIVPRKAHNISRKMIHEHALKVLYRLRKGNYEAHLVGGSVRDLLLGHEPKDFDIATSAKPEQVKKLFNNCRLIGKRFRLAHVFFGREIIEVATFRAEGKPSKQSMVSDHGVILRDNVYGTLEDDIWRRDFTINALYYNIEDFSVLDCVGGIDDLEHGIIRLIGDPVTRYQEDPVRMLRAIRFAAKLGFNIHPATEAPIRELRGLLGHMSNARLFDECLKLFLTGNASHTYTLLHQYDVLEMLFPLTSACLSDPNWHQATHNFLFTLFENTDNRIDDGKPVTPTYIFAALLWLPIIKRKSELMAQGLSPIEAFETAVNEVATEQQHSTAIPRRYSAAMREIWHMQYGLERHHGKKPFKMVYLQRFRAAYDFLLLRQTAEPTVKNSGDWWTAFIDADEEERTRMCHPPKGRRKQKKTDDE